MLKSNGCKFLTLIDIWQSRGRRLFLFNVSLILFYFILFWFHWNISDVLNKSENNKLRIKHEEVQTKHNKLNHVYNDTKKNHTELQDELQGKQTPSSYITDIFVEHFNLIWIFFSLKAQKPAWLSYRAVMMNWVKTTVSYRKKWRSWRRR